ncbi:two-component regulator propeller domain-containing protein [Paradesertivirga mongoliensis]|uniref:histidine kinase n=1 Tax=Paradesertivirga mongoliensis TaxID=2100740 RepID=A0ABW4ZRV8_9SPHI|nr:hybrid sensor histidine kinase/response regulator transcription factor [Pedobacter mongoliensis]
MIFLLKIVVPLTALADQPELKLTNISREHGLSNSTVFCIYQDSYGFIWFGTGDGLNRYDGAQMQVYRNDAKINHTISDNYVKYIYEDSQRNLWVGTTNGLNLFDRKLGRFKRFFFNPEGKSGNDISCVLEDRKKNLWIGTHGAGLAILDKKVGKLRSIAPEYKNKAPLSLNHINHLFEDSKQNLWIATNQGIVILDIKQKQLKKLDIQGKSRIDVRTICEDSQGKKWIATEGNGIFVYSPGTGKFHNYNHQEKQSSSLGSNLVRTLMIDKDGKVWSGCVTGGLNLLDSKTNSFYRYIPDRTVSALFEDNQGNLWAGTHRGGVYLYAPNAQKFNVVQIQTSPHILSNNDVRAFFEDKKGNIWIGTDGGGVSKYNPETKKAIKFRHQTASPNSLGSDFILDIIGDNNSNVWISSWGGGISLYNEKNSKFTRYLNRPQDSSSISSNYVHKMIPDEKGNFWVGTYFGGLNYLNTVSGRFTRIPSTRNIPRAMWGNNVISMCEDVKKGNLWIGTDDAGLNYFDKASQSFQHYFVDGASLQEIRIIFKDRKNRIWVGAKGIYLYNRKKNRFDRYTKAPSLNADFIKGILEDDKGHLWISTLNGLVNLDPEKGSTRRFNTSDGLQSLEFEANAVLKTRNGVMYFGGINGYNYFHPENIPTNNFIPPVYFTELSIFNKRAVPLEEGSPLKEDLPFVPVINLNYKQSSFSVSYAALNYTSPNNNQYAYKLEGFDKEWNYVGNATKASYTNLDPGDYILKVKAANNDGIWSNRIANLEISIAPPFWQRIWFQLITVALIISIVYYVLSLKRKLELEKLEEKKKDEIHQMQLEFFTNISHEFRTPLALIIGRLDRLVKENSNKDLLPHIRSLFKNSAHLLNLLNELMDFRKVESGALQLHVSKGNLSSFLDELAEEFIILAQEKNIQLSIEKHEEISEAWFDRQVMEKIITNLIHNSIKYTPPGGQISVEIVKEWPERTFENELSIRSGYNPVEALGIRVKDSGIGITRDSLKLLFERYFRITDAHLGSGVGLAFVKSLAMLHKGDIYVSSEKNQGTEIVISIPCTENDYSATEKRTEHTKTGLDNLESILTEPDIGIFDHTPLAESDEDISAANKRRILLVEDNDEMRNMLKESLSAYFHVSEASNGAEGYLKVKEEFPELIISDVMMGVMGGIEFCKRVRENIETSHIPFIMLTAKSSLEAQISGIETGADLYFPKPVSVQLLLLTIQNIFNQRRKLKTHSVKGHQAELKELVHSTKEREFIVKVLTIIEKYMEDPNFDADRLCREIAMSKTNLYHKLKSITGHSISEFIRSVRLNKAKEIMVNEDVLINEVMFRVGIQTQSYFTRVFKSEFGTTPRQFLQEVRARN